jgi:hypothetical protein
VNMTRLLFVLWVSYTIVACSDHKVQTKSRENIITPSFSERGRCGSDGMIGEGSEYIYLPTKTHKNGKQIRVLKAELEECDNQGVCEPLHEGALNVRDYDGGTGSNDDCGCGWVCTCSASSHCPSCTWNQGWGSGARKGHGSGGGSGSAAL